MWLMSERRPQGAENRGLRRKMRTVLNFVNSRVKPPEKTVIPGLVRGEVYPVYSPRVGENVGEW